MRGGCGASRMLLRLAMVTLALCSVSALDAGASQGGKSLRNAPSAASPRNYSSPPHLSTPSKVSSQAHSSSDDQGEGENFLEDNATLSDHNFQQLINQQPSANNNSRSSTFLLKLSSYLLNKPLKSESIKSHSSEIVSYNADETSKVKPILQRHVEEKHPPFEDYLGPIQFQSSLTHKKVPREQATTKQSSSTTSLYLQWDRDSSEQEIEAEKDVNLTEMKPTWFLLALSGNETIAKLRREDFVKYVRVNVATRLSLQYDEVKVIRLQLTPRILLNISIASSLRSPVMALLAADTAPLLELSGEEYIIAPLEDPATAEHQTGVVPSSPEGSHDDLEAAVCALAGGACALAAGAALLVAALFRRQRPRNDMVVQRPEPLRLPPAVIYTGRLENEERKNVQGISSANSSIVKTPMDPRVQPDTLPLDARFVEELGLDNPNFLTP